MRGVAIYRLAAAGVVAMLLGGCASTPPEEDPVQIRLNDLDTRLTRTERVVASQGQVQLANDVEALRSEVKAMRNEVDQINNKLDLDAKRQHDLYADLDQRLKTIESRSGIAGGVAAGEANPAAPPAAAAPADGTDQGNYQAAFALLKNSQYERAIAGFRQFLLDFPQSPLAENAQYWLGEAYYVNKAYPEALQAFQGVSEKYPQSRKLADALLKQGYCLYELKQWAAARQILAQVAQQYTDVSAGRLAQQRLDRMSSEKH
jgi:tol-pal system protein YbgF